MLVPHKELRKRRSPIIEHVWSQPLPKKSLVQITEDVYVTSPEFCFLELASFLDLGELIAVGYELCGTYSLDPLSGNAIFDLAAATCANSIVSFLDSMPSCRGIKRAKQAARHIHDGSASPMETSVHMRFSLPSKLGGYGLPRSLLNHEINLNNRARRLAKTETCRCDIYFPKIKLDVEFNSVEFHKNRIQEDAARSAALKFMGLEVLSITKRQYDEYFAFGELVRGIAKMHGRRMRNSQLEITPSRICLFSSLQRYMENESRSFRMNQCSKRNS